MRDVIARLKKHALRVSLTVRGALTDLNALVLGPVVCVPTIRPACAYRKSTAGAQE